MNLLKFQWLVFHSVCHNPSKHFDNKWSCFCCTGCRSQIDKKEKYFDGNSIVNQGRLGPKMYSAPSQLSPIPTLPTFQFVNILDCFITLHCWNHITNIWTYSQTWKDVFLNYYYIFENERIFYDLGNKNILQAILVALQNTLHVINALHVVLCI